MRNTARRDRLIRLAQLAQRHPDGLRGCAAELWCSRRAHPALPAWQDDAHRLHLREQTLARDDPAPKAVACAGLLARWGQACGPRAAELGLRFVEGRPVRAVTIDVLAWCGAQAQARGKRAILLVWDKATAQPSPRGRTWVRPPTRQVKQGDHGVRLLRALLPSKSPWLHPLAPQWVPGQRKVRAPPRLVATAALLERVCAVEGCPPEPHLVAPPTATKTAA